MYHQEAADRQNIHIPLYFRMMFHTPMRQLEPNLEPCESHLDVILEPKMNQRWPQDDPNRPMVHDGAADKQNMHLTTCFLSFLMARMRKSWTIWDYPGTNLRPKTAPICTTSTREHQETHFTTS